MNRSLLMLLVALLPLAAPGAGRTETYACQREGDDPRWAAPEWDDHDWTPGNTVPARAGIHWLRFHLKSLGMMGLLKIPPKAQISGVGPGAPVDAIYIPAPYSYEIFWDGQLLGRSGLVGATAETEQVGALDHVLPIPADLRGPGEHVVAIRMSSFHYNFPATQIEVGFLPVNTAGHHAAEIRHLTLPLVSLGGALLVALICALLFVVVERSRPLLLCSLLSFALAAFYLLVAGRWLYNAPYDWFCPRLVATTLVMGLIAVIFPWLLLEQFGLPRRAWWLATLLILLAGAWTSSPLYEVKALWLCRVMLGTALAVAAWGARLRRPGAWLVFAGVATCLVLVRADRRDFLDATFFASFTILVFYVFALLGLQLRAERQRAREAGLTKARLEIELLKKNLQPHFLLNTLTAVSEVIEQDPAGAVKFIDDLAAEFRSLALMAGERLVPLQRELDLCRAHLKVIGRRTSRHHDLIVEGATEEILVPPALFLTLIENGLVHQEKADGAAFRLLARRAGPGWSFVFVSPGQLRELTGRATGGTGLRYVKARLEESFPGRWTFSQAALANSWETVISWQNEAIAGGRP